MRYVFAAPTTQWLISPNTPPPSLLSVTNALCGISIPHNLLVFLQWNHSLLFPPRKEIRFLLLAPFPNLFWWRGWLPSKLMATHRILFSRSRIPTKFRKYSLLQRISRERFDANPLDSASLETIIASWVAYDSCLDIYAPISYKLTSSNEVEKFHTLVAAFETLHGPWMLQLLE